MYYLCEKYYNPSTVQYCMADCVNLVLALTIELTNLLLEGNLFVYRGLAVTCRRFVDNLYQAEEILFYFTERVVVDFCFQLYCGFLFHLALMLPSALCILKLCGYIQFKLLYHLSYLTF